MFKVKKTCDKLIVMFELLVWPRWDSQMSCDWKITSENSMA